MNATTNAAVTTEQISARLAMFVERLTSFLNETNINAALYSYAVTLEAGKNNIRIVRSEVSSKTGETMSHTRSAYGFIDAATGNILKSDGWKRPAKGVRGSIFAADFCIGKNRPCGMYSAS
ncbi:hypothetical protein [Paraburkholderia sp. GAS32]|uniref:DUF7717 family protein n=1 Tax=Paraburkholderia sp. GAS32 TaxID=3035129 RepID=UPI003D21E355